MILRGDALAIPLADSSVDCVVTSPPYWGLRDYGDPDQLGLESTPYDYVNNMIRVFREVRRVLKATGTLWLNLGDSYASGGMSDPSNKSTMTGGKRLGNLSITRRDKSLCPKSLVGIPWKVAFALQHDGWILRSDIIWHKPNPMPESVRDRPTKAHEYLFMFAKQQRYYWNQDAVSEKAIHAGEVISIAPKTLSRGQATGMGVNPSGNARANFVSVKDRRNIRSVWSIATQPFPGAHFAVMPPKLIEPCIKAGCPEGGTVFDPFFGAGTVGLVADRLRRKWIGMDLSKEYCHMARNRIRDDCPMFAQC